jgi:hypothetical protein
MTDKPYKCGNIKIELKFFGGVEIVRKKCLCYTMIGLVYTHGSQGQVPCPINLVPVDKRRININNILIGVLEYGIRETEKNT